MILRMVEKEDVSLNKEELAKSFGSKIRIGIRLVGHSIFEKRALELWPLKDEEYRSVLAAKISLLKKVCKALGAHGLAAPQLGWADRLVVTRSVQGDFNVFINPEILESSGESTEQEFCYSLPGGFGYQVTRPNEIVVEYWDERFEKRKAVLTDLEARALQHEVDHLEGKFIFDYLDGRGSYEHGRYVKARKKALRGAKHLDFSREFDV